MFSGVPAAVKASVLGVFGAADSAISGVNRITPQSLDPAFRGLILVAWVCLLAVLLSALADLLRWGVDRLIERMLEARSAAAPRPPVHPSPGPPAVPASGPGADPEPVHAIGKVWRGRDGTWCCYFLRGGRAGIAFGAPTADLAVEAAQAHWEGRPDRLWASDQRGVAI